MGLEHGVEVFDATEVIAQFRAAGDADEGGRAGLRLAPERDVAAARRGFELPGVGFGTCGHGDLLDDG